MSLDKSTIKSETRSAFAPDYAPAANALWKLKKVKASVAFGTLYDETICGADLSLSEEQEIQAEDMYSKDKKPYGDVRYADPGYQKDGQKRYPIDTEAHIRAAWSYINQTKNAAQYSSSQVSKIKSRIISAWKSKIDPKGPPSAT